MLQPLQTFLNIIHIIQMAIELNEYLSDTLSTETGPYTVFTNIGFILGLLQSFELHYMLLCLQGLGIAYNLTLGYV